MRNELRRSNDNESSSTVKTLWPPSLAPSIAAEEAEEEEDEEADEADVSMPAITPTPPPLLAAVRKMSVLNKVCCRFSLATDTEADDKEKDETVAAEEADVTPLNCIFGGGRSSPPDWVSVFICAVGSKADDEAVEDEDDA